MSGTPPRLTLVADCGGRVHRRARRRRLTPRGAWRWFLGLFFEVFPMHLPDGPPASPSPVAPIAKTGFLREGALLYVIDGEPVGRHRLR
ncbi:MAG TPA: hypothetical protein VKS60_07685 [Stellaceae bacterium]|nr:hypothetical protein [Stellaceae bacterium]